MGVARADDRLVPAAEFTSEGWPVYVRSAGSGFVLVVEAKPGGSNTPVGGSAFNWDPTNPAVLPDLAVVVSRPLGNGSLDVCDDAPPRLGGVPASTMPVSIPATQEVANVINDLSCRFKNGEGSPGGRNRDEACTAFDDGTYRFVGTGATVQFCALVNEAIGFPAGDTEVTARVRDQAGRWSAPQTMVIRIP